MTDLAFPFWAVYQVHENRLALAEALPFPEVTRLGGDRGRLRRLLQRNVAHLVEQAPPSGLARRHIADAPAVAMVALALDPVPGSILWRQPLPLRFPVLHWSHGHDAELALVPALGIMVLAARPDELQERLVPEVRAALARNWPTLTLQTLVSLQRATELRVESVTTAVHLRSPKARALAAEREREQTPSVLAKVATDLTHYPPEPTHGLDPLVGQLAELLTARRPRSVLLVGPSGVGKTAAVRELVRQRALHNLGATPFWATSGARLVAGMTGYGMWQGRCQQVVREVARRRAVVHLGNLVELMEVGKSEHHHTGLAAFLRPALARGELLAIAECTPEQVPLVEREDPHLLDVFHRVTVAEPDGEQGRAILRHVAAHAPWDRRQTLGEDTLETLDRLHRRYATYSAYPGRPLRFLHNLLDDHRDPLRPAHVLTAFTRETGLPRVLLDPAERLDLARTRAWFGERVIGQGEAVDLVTDLLATTKAGLTRPRKPIASLLFIGPTGVGKTEMAKALAEFLFGSRQRLTRFDMSEYGDPLSVQRLVGGVFGSEGLLTARVREQPFSVLLLDEFEKAHPLFLDLLLQVLGEGRLTDAAGRLADFCNTVVILTSNLGAESFQQGAFGFGGEAAADTEARREAARAHFLHAVQAHVRPELFNRIDRLVPFAPLDAATINRIAQRHLGRLERRDGVYYRGVTLDFGEGVAAYLARHGFDARYGARPLLRAVERELLAPLADQMNRYSAELALAVDVRLVGDALEVGVKPRTDASGRTISPGTAAAPLVEAAGQCVDLRRQVQALDRCPPVREFRNELFRLEREQKRFEEAQRRHAARLSRLAGAPEAVRRRAEEHTPIITPIVRDRMTRLARLREINERLRDLAARSFALENEALQALYADVGAETLDPGDLTTAADPLWEYWHDLLLTFYSRQFIRADRLTLAVFSEDPASLAELTAAYLAVMRQRKTGVEMVAYRLPTGNRAARESVPPRTAETDEAEEPPSQFWRVDGDRHVLVVAADGRQPEREVLTREVVENPVAFVQGLPPRLIGVGLRLHGPAAAPRFTPEAGLHVFRSSRQPQPGKCLVESSDADLAAYLPPAGITRKGAIGVQDRRRTYDRGLEVLDDALLGQKIAWQNRPLGEALGEAIDKLLERNLLAILEE